jgi:hypothetical protein
MIVAKGSGIDSGLVSWRIGEQINYFKPGGMIRLHKEEEVYKAEVTRATMYCVERCPYCGVLYEGREVQCTRCGGPR